MDSPTWKALCSSAGNQKGYVMHVDRPLDAHDFQCSLCGSIWRTIMKLDGEPHRALQNQCGGVWKPYEPAREKTVEPSKAPVEGSPAQKIMVNGEEYEIEE